MNWIMKSAVLFGVFIIGFSSCVSEEEIRSRSTSHTAPIPQVKYVKVNTPSNIGIIHKSSIAEFEKVISDKVGTLVDVRTPEEFAKGHLKGAVNVNFKKRTFPSYISAIDKNKPVLIYCRSGNRSGKAAHIMQSLGFKEVYDLAKGYKGWVAGQKNVVQTDNDANKALQASLKANAPNPMAVNNLGNGLDVDVEEFERLIKSGKVTLVDVRTPDEFAKSHLAGAVNVDWKNRHFAENILKISNVQPVAIYCRSGNRSTRAMYAMRSLGFSKVYNLNHGFKSWNVANKAVESSNANAGGGHGGEEGC